ncbi:hypothetical protein PR003_g14419 [Phytophthora rubi]|uniref:RxLR effector protein n=1 Tax=Phytophthora rubi TaxID=129364 RepID=A0A6A4EZJ3_9STRA|nr:hypothetical protein PR002_g14179 [Phytophthora rubi]KAE9020309.1 hypothetical protein PR001_g13631 [Phytophthora rubi]KAE9332623.1 hypothetical protein PR003_g14419 [Phytophthora rubi]
MIATKSSPSLIGLLLFQVQTLVGRSAGSKTAMSIGTDRAHSNIVMTKQHS